MKLVLIDKSVEAKAENLLAMCPMCHATYLIDDNKRSAKSCKTKRRLLQPIGRAFGYWMISLLKKGITGIIIRIKSLRKKT